MNWNPKPNRIEQTRLQRGPECGNCGDCECCEGFDEAAEREMDSRREEE